MGGRLPGLTVRLAAATTCENFSSFILFDYNYPKKPKFKRGGCS